MKQVLAKYGVEGSFHDIQFKKDREEKALYFDLLLPYSVTEDTASQIMGELKTLVKEEKGINCVVELDRPIVDTAKED